MKTIVVKTQSEFDSLPEKFDDFTVIEIRSDPNIWITVNKARDSSRVVAWGSSRVVAWGSSRVEARDSSSVVAWGSSRVVAWGSSRVVAWDSSSVEAWDSSSVEAWDFCTIQALSPLVVLTLFNFSIASVRGFKPKTKIIRKHKTTTISETPERIERSFEEWLDGGYVHADGITKKFLSKKKIGNLEVFEVEEFLERKSSYVVKKGDIFSHGKTIKEAKASLKYKTSSRDTSEFKKWKLNTVVTQAKMIEAYRVITGACEHGVRSFMEGKKMPSKLSVKKAIEVTSGAYGNEQFVSFFK